MSTQSSVEESAKKKKILHRRYSFSWISFIYDHLYEYVCITRNFFLILNFVKIYTVYF